MLDELPQNKSLHIADMGSGKGYLTFALYDYLVNHLQRDTTMTGVEFRKDLVDLCNQIAVKSGFKNLQFVEGSIEAFDCTGINMLIALHACDTATDDAIYKGIQAHADLIVVAPCCHKQIRREMEQGKKPHELDFILRHGIYLEREAEMITDSMRALFLEYAGYKTKVFEFISEAHTPKNVMIVAQKVQEASEQRQQEALSKIRAAKTFFGIHKHYLETLMKL